MLQGIQVTLYDVYGFFMPGAIAFAGLGVQEENIQNL